MAGLLLLAVVAGLAAHLLLGATPPATPVARPLELTPWAEGLDCPHGLAWSPHQTHLALIGYQGGCPDLLGPFGVTASQQPTYGLLLIYAVGGTATPGSLVARLQPDAAIRHATALPPGYTAYAAHVAATVGSSYNPYDIDYTGLLWSPDGTRLALLDTELGTITIWGPGQLPR